MLPLKTRHLYEVRPRADRRGIDLISDALPFGRLWYGEPNAVAKRNRICRASQSITRCCNSRLRCRWQCDPEPRTCGGSSKNRKTFTRGNPQNYLIIIRMTNE